jgi:diguanylate cyclase (GGDEF)-like protein
MTVTFMHRAQTLAHTGTGRNIGANSGNALGRSNGTAALAGNASPSEFGRRARVKVAVIYGLTTIIPLLVMVYIIQSNLLSRRGTDVAWISSLALIALGVALLGGKIMKEVWAKVGHAVEMIERIQREHYSVASSADLKPIDEIDRIPSVVTRLVEITKQQMQELKSYNEQIQLLNSKLREANQKLHQISIEDSLTGLYNRRYFDDRIGHEIARTRRFGRELALAMIDIDFFKNYNDHAGHLAGDKALSTIGTIIRQSLRETDLSFRYGGEEFAILLPETTAESATAVAERIRSAVEKHEFPNESAQPNGVLTVSVGVSMLGEHSYSLEELVSAADRALYRAKSSGRNRVVAHSED